jgi:PAS domain S-box-containing protein
MKQSKSAPADAAELRRRAEERLREKSSRSQAGGRNTAEETQRLVHELQVHQIELELQNEELQRARGELEAGLERYTDLYDFAPMGYLTLGSDGAIRKVNLTGARLLELERSRLVGRRFGLFVSHQGRPTFNAFLKKVFERQTKETCEVELCTEKSASPWVHIEAVASADGRECRVVLANITERRRVEETLRFRMSLMDCATAHSLEELLQTTLDAVGALTGSPVGFYHFVESDQKTISLQAWSRRTIEESCTAEGQGKHYGIDQAGVWADCARQRQPVIHNDYASLPHRKGLPEGHAVILRELVVPILRQGRIVAIVGVGNKSTDYTDGDVEIVTYLADVAWEIIERKRSEEALQVSERLHRAIGESIEYGVWISAPDGRNTYASESFLKLVGLTQEQCSNFGWGDVLHPDDAERTMARWKECVRTGDKWDIEHRFRGVDGQWHPVLARGVPVRNERGEIDGWAGINLDISHLKQTEADLREREAALREADQRKNEFLAGLSHELRNPLSPIANSLYILDHAAPGSDQARHAQAVIGRQVGQLSRLVDDLLDVTRVSHNKLSLQWQRLELNELVRRTVDDHRLQFDQNEVRLELFPAPEPVFVDGDRHRLAQIVGNLLQNAVKFTGLGGTTRVSVSTDTPAKRAVVRVADTGVGMAKEMLARLFQPFAQADSTLARNQGGLGLGLALVKGLVEMHGGDIEAHSAGPGQGAEFVVSLPLTLGEAPADRRAHSGAPAPGGRRRVLIIDDNVDAADMLREALELSRHEVEVAYNGPTGIAKAREYRPEVVLCDIGLPGMDGYQVARTFKADEGLCSVFLVALTGYALTEDLAQAQEAGFDRHLAKPPSLEQIEELLGAYARQARGNQQRREDSPA